jgi:hypothetical protein
MFPSETPTVTVTAEPSQSPEPSSQPNEQLQQLQQLNATTDDLAGDLVAVRALLLLSGGLAICLLAALFVRSRKS